MKRLTLEECLVLRAVRCIDLKVRVICCGKITLWLLVNHRLLRIWNCSLITNILNREIDRRCNLLIDTGSTLIFQLLVLHGEHLDLGLLLLVQLDKFELGLY